ncbi:MAG: hypothetical protein KAV87_59245, partial [Desulfobacteraceae bacterium]|nr:hypothetical protein [Desulfobacteraceae bacterium]
MVTAGQGKRKKRITEEMITDMKHLYLTGLTISAIAEKLNVHRQTVTGYVAPKNRDIIADDVRKQLLEEGLRNHFNQLGKFVREVIRKPLNAAAPGKAAMKETISTAGILGLPYTATGTPHYITEEWERMYTFSARDQHSLLSLREHTRDSKLWVPWDRWHKKVAPFEGASRALRDWLGVKLEEDPPEDIRDIEIVRSWVFGNMLGMASGREPVRVETLNQSAEPGEFRSGIYSNLSHFQRYAQKVFDEAMDWPDLNSLKAAMADLADAKSQLELKGLAGEIDFALAGIEL